MTHRGPLFKGVLMLWVRREARAQLISFLIILISCIRIVLFVINLHCALSEVTLLHLCEIQSYYRGGAIINLPLKDIP